MFSAFNIIAKPSGSRCNLNCTYCFYLEKSKLYPDEKNQRMPDRVLEAYIRQYIDSQPVEEVTFVWQGGEPTLMGIEFFEKALYLQRKYNGGKTIRNAFQTNGILLDDDWGKFLAENNFLVGISIDGPADIHDKYRRFKGGQPSFEKVMQGLGILKKYRVEFNTLTCVQRDNSCKALDVYHFLKNIGSRYMQFIPVVERVRKDANPSDQRLVSPDFQGAADVMEWSVEPLQYGLFLQEIFDEWVRLDVGRIFVQIFDVCLNAWYGYPAGLCLFNETCGNALALEQNGDLYSCDHFVYTENRLGNILDKPILTLVNSDRQVRFGMAKKRNLPKQCQRCEFRFICNGGCPKNRFIRTDEGESGLNYLCEGYRHFFRHIDEAMRFMVNELKNERPPANVMKWMAER